MEQRLREEVRRGVQTIQYQVVTLMTTNGQAPFVTVFMYLNEAKSEQEKRDLAMVIEEVLRSALPGREKRKGRLGNPGVPQAGVCVGRGQYSPDAPYYYLTELAAKCTAKRMVPDYISEKIMKQLKVDQNGDGQCYTCMGCRSFLTPYVDENGKPKYYGRFNQGVVTVNLVDIGLSAGKDMDKFWEIFDERMELCHRALQCRHERLTGTVSDVAPILWQYGALARAEKGREDRQAAPRRLFHHFSGLCRAVGMRIQHDRQKADRAGRRGISAWRSCSKLNEYTAKWKKAENIDYSLYGTPAGKHHL